MNILSRIFSWKSLSLALVGVLAIVIIAIAYFWIDGSFSGVDGGLGLVVSVFYCIVIGIAISVVALLKRVTKNNERVSRAILTLLWIIFVVGIGSIGLLLSRESSRELSCTPGKNYDASQVYNADTGKVESVCSL